MDFFSKLKEQLKKINLQKLNLNSKLVINLMVVLAVGVGFILVADFYKDLDTGGLNNQPKQTLDAADSSGSESNKPEYITELEGRLTEILGRIQDAGKVSVMITLKTGSEIIPAMNESISDKTTNEKDTSGGLRTINEKSTAGDVVVVSEQGGASKPLVLKEINPEINGVIIVAEGAKDPKVKMKLAEAVQTVLDVPAYRVSVFESNK